MAKKTLNVQKVSVKKGKSGRFLSIQNDDNDWYTHFGEDEEDSDLIGKIWTGGEIAVIYETTKNGKYTNRIISKYKVKNAGEKPEDSTQSRSGSSDPKVQQQIQQNFEAKQDSIVRQVCLKEASPLVAGVIKDAKDTEGIIATVVTIAEGYYQWVTKENKDTTKTEDSSDDLDDDDTDSDVDLDDDDFGDDDDDL